MTDTCITVSVHPKPTHTEQDRALDSTTVFYIVFHILTQMNRAKQFRQ